MTVINESGKAVRWNDSREPNIGTSKAWCALNGLEGEYYTLFEGHGPLEAGLRTEANIRIFRENLDALGLSAGDAKTIDFVWSLYPDAEKIDYVQFNIHAE
ncbi:MAG: hypothetical protein IJJ42_10345 [Clostridia bacterium]|nr:hypothetical protein [Clostridia bacterium]